MMTTVGRQPAGVPTGGQFAPGRRVRSDVALDGPNEPFDRLDLLIAAVDPRGVGWTTGSDQQVTLEDMSGRAFATGNCYPATAAFANALAETGEDSGLAIQVLYDDDCCHYANIFAIDGVEHVVDWTFTQFDRDGTHEHPYVGTRDQWEQDLAWHAGGDYGCTRSITTGTPESFAEHWRRGMSYDDLGDIILLPGML